MRLAARHWKTTMLGGERLAKAGSPMPSEAWATARHPTRWRGARAAATVGALVYMVLLGVSVADTQPWSIVPGKAIGPVQIGMSMSEAEKALHRFGPVVQRIDTSSNSIQIANGSSESSDWLDRCSGLSVQDRVWHELNGKSTPGAVAEISTCDPRFVLDGGARPNDPVLRALNGLGTPDLVTSVSTLGIFYSWNGQGIRVIGKQRGDGIMISEIDVFLTHH